MGTKALDHNGAWSSGIPARLTFSRSDERGRPNAHWCRRNSIRVQHCFPSNDSLSHSMGLVCGSDLVAFSNHANPRNIIARVLESLHRVTIVVPQRKPNLPDWCERIPNDDGDIGCPRGSLLHLLLLESCV